MTKLDQLASLGQSIWYDYIRKALITSGDLKVLINQGLRGMTSNPSIFEKAISGSADYDADLKILAEEDKTVQEIYESLALKDIVMAADLFRPVYDETQGLDGYVSLEVNPDLAHDTEKTVSEGRRLFEALHRPNVMIKVPATKAGIPAIAELITSGVNVNVTLLFSVEIYKEVAEAYLNGLEGLLARGPAVDGGHTLEGIASVASFPLTNPTWNPRRSWLAKWWMLTKKRGDFRNPRRPSRWTVSRSLQKRRETASRM